MWNIEKSEKAIIVDISNDGYTLTLLNPLKFRHIAVCTDNNGGGWDWAGTLCQRAEVGLLTRNVKVKGNINQEFVEWLPPCELGIGGGSGFDFGTQSRG